MAKIKLGGTSVLKKVFSPSTEIDKWRLFTMIAFVLIVIGLAWQSDDAYHGYVMSRHLVEGHGLVYNIGERSTASTCPLFTLIIAAAYFVTREMFFTSLAVCTLLSVGSYYILAYRFCKTKEQVIIGFLALAGSQAFISYTTSGLENSLLFFLSAVFLETLAKAEKYNAKAMLKLAVVFSLLAMARMDEVLLFIPVIVWIYLFRRENVSFIQAVGLGILGLMPFILWEAFATFYFGFPFPNPAYVKLGTAIPMIQYLKRGVLYAFYTALDDAVVVIIPAVVVILTMFSKKLKYILVAAGLAVYGIYVVRIGGDFMMGRHFTNMLFVSVALFMIMQNNEMPNFTMMRKLRSAFNAAVVITVLFAATFGRTVGSQYLLGHTYSSQISDEREYYFNTTGLYNNVVSLVRNGRLCIPDTWNNDAILDLKANGLNGGIIENAAGILVYYNPDLYLNDTYSLGDPFLSKLPATYNDNWRVGHLRREVPHGYRASVWFDRNEIKDPDLHEYYEKIRLITRGNLFDPERLKAIVEINTGKYQHLIDSYEARRAQEEER